jgi:hypothetical protein
MNKLAAYQYLIDNHPLWEDDSLDKQAGLISNLTSGLGKSIALSPVKSFGTGLSRAAKGSLSDLRRTGATRRSFLGLGGDKLTNKAGLGDTLKFYGSRAADSTGQFIANNPGAATAIGVGGLGAAGLGTGYMLTR